MSDKILIWTKDLSVGVKEFDRQHRHFIDLMNQAYDLFYNPARRDELPEFLSKLLAYAAEHFVVEEKYFAEHNYPLAVEHQEEHEKLKKYAAAMLARYEREGETIIGELLGFLQGWLAEHFDACDKKYTSFFKAKGVR